jgi:hypothetical protein
LIQVSDPILVEGITRYVQYKVTGDLLKETIYRRFSDFYSLREKLVERWPGIYIPNLPPKVTVGNLEKKVIETRTRVINDFCHKTSKFKFILDSEELQIFLIKSIDVSKVINNLPKLNYDEILFRYNKAFPDVKAGDDIELEKYLKSINNAIPYMKKVLLNLKGFEESILATMTQKENEINYYCNLMNVFEDYEKYTLMEYVNNDENKLVFYNPKNSETYRKIMDIKDKFINLFKNLSSWIEDDILDFKAMLQALESIINLNAVLEGLTLRLKAIEEEILKYQNNEYNYFTLLIKWKTAEGILLELKNEENNTKNTIRSITSIITIACKITLNNLEIFKVEKLQRYHKHIKRFAEVQKDNGDIINDLWSYISNDPKLNDKDKDVVSQVK